MPVFCAGTPELTEPKTTVLHLLGQLGQQARSPVHGDLNVSLPVPLRLPREPPGCTLRWGIRRGTMSHIPGRLSLVQPGSEGAGNWGAALRMPRRAVLGP